MFSHVFIATADFERTLAFYEPLMFLVGAPFEGEHAAGNGQMTAFIAPDRATVDRAHALALAHGGSCAGAPGLRPDYHADYYGAYFRDPDGNKLCVVCHEGM
jgi:lactoylglutathione lyase